ncbi:MAG: ComEC/Rec2 family competence protein [Alkalispirochaeta sp.]
MLVIMTDTLASRGGEHGVIVPLLYTVPAVLFFGGIVLVWVLTGAHRPRRSRTSRTSHTSHTSHTSRRSQTSHKSPRSRPGGRRLLASAVLALLLSGWIAGTDYRSRRPPVASLAPSTAHQVRGVCRADLRPSSEITRVLPVALTEVRTHSGWKGSAQGRITLIWSGREYLTTTGSDYTIVPQRGDVVEVRGTWSDGARPVIWAESADIRVEPAHTQLSIARRKARGFIRRRLARLSQDPHTMALALLLGTRGEMSPEMIAGVRGAGASHVIALSGMHLGVLALLLTKTTARIGSPRIRRLTVAVALCGYVWIAGWIPSLVRALVLVGVVLVSVDRDRSLPPAVMLSRCVLITALVAPGMVAALGFQLSVWALVGLFFLSPRLVERLSAVVPYPVAGYLGVTLGPLISTAPVSLAVFGTVYPVGLLAAGVLALLAVVLMWSSLAFTLLASVPVVGSLVVGALTEVTRAFLHLSTLFATVPGIDLTKPGGLISAAGWCTLLIAGGALAIYLARRQHGTVRRFLEFHDQPQFDF